MRTRTHKSAGATPVWNQQLTMDVFSTDQYMKVDVWDEDRGKDDHIGECRVNLADAMRDLKQHAWYDSIAQQCHALCLPLACALLRTPKSDLTVASISGLRYLGQRVASPCAARLICVDWRLSDSVHSRVCPTVRVLKRLQLFRRQMDYLARRPKASKTHRHNYAVLSLCRREGPWQNPAQRERSSTLICAPQLC